MIRKTLILLAVIFVILGLHRIINNKSVVKNDQIIQEEKELTCPYYLENNPYKEDVGVEYDVRVSGKPKFISSPEIIKLDKPFNKVEFEKNLYKLSNDKGWESREFDVDKDDKNEMIINANFAMNHTPNIAMIVKNKTIIFEATGASIMIEKIPQGNGFLLSETVDWNIGEIKTTRYLYKEGGFLPVFTQKSCLVYFK